MVQYEGEGVFYQLLTKSQLFSGSVSGLWPPKHFSSMSRGTPLPTRLSTTLLVCRVPRRLPSKTCLFGQCLHSALPTSFYKAQKLDGVRNIPSLWFGGKWKSSSSSTLSKSRSRAVTTLTTGDAYSPG